ncbi:MAG: hypothetical protein Kow0092_29640 [Deferrisomatales bacterium]
MLQILTIVAILAVAPAAVLGAQLSRGTAARPPAPFQSPLDTPGLPRPVASALVEAGCRIPVSSERPSAVRADFSGDGAADWAVLCSREGVTTIRLFWGGSARCPAVLAPVPDASLLHETAGQTRYVRTIRAVDPKETRTVRQAESATTVRRTTGVGIGDGYLDEVDVVYLCRDGTWVELAP